MACHLISAKPLSKPYAGLLSIGSLGTNFNQNTKLFIHENASDYIVWKKVSILSRGDELNSTNLHF